MRNVTFLQFPVFIRSLSDTLFEKSAEVGHIIETTLGRDLSYLQTGTGQKVFGHRYSCLLDEFCGSVSGNGLDLSVELDTADAE